MMLALMVSHQAVGMNAMAKTLDTLLNKKEEASTIMVLEEYRISCTSCVLKKAEFHKFSANCMTQLFFLYPEPKLFIFYILPQNYDRQQKQENIWNCLYQFIFY